jgi:hypothetical protein
MGNHFTSDFRAPVSFRCKRFNLCESNLDDGEFRGHKEAVEEYDEQNEKDTE